MALDRRHLGRQAFGDAGTEDGLEDEAHPYDIYARVSRVKSKKENEPSTGGQVAICRLRLAELDLPEGKVLVDPGLSAWNPAIKRPAWDELMDRLERGVSGGFIVFDLERFTRQPPDAERIIELAVRGLAAPDPEPAEPPVKTARQSTRGQAAQLRTATDQ